MGEISSRLRPPQSFAGTSAIIGAKRMEQLEDNLVAVDVAWTDDELAALSELTAPPNIYPYWMQAMFSRT